MSWIILNDDVTDFFVLRFLYNILSISLRILSKFDLISFMPLSTPRLASVARFWGDSSSRATSHKDGVLLVEVVADNCDVGAMVTVEFWPLPTADTEVPKESAAGCRL
jgi:hypothetical protein